MTTDVAAYLGQPLPRASSRRLSRNARAPRRPVPTMSTTRRSRSPSVTRVKSPTSRMDPSSQSNLPSSRVRVLVEAPAPNKRLITANNLINAPLHIVWGLLSDYDRLSHHIPNLMRSDLLAHPANGIRVEQCGAQSILGFQFRASLVMDMTEINPASTDWRAINFALVQSRDFQEFEGVWRMETVDINRTALYYTVQIVPKGLVPVRAIEWRIAEDVPGNMTAVRQECERRRRMAVAANRRQDIAQFNGTEI